jgi:hypothetical protein
LGLASAIILAIASLIASLPSQKVQAASIDLRLTRALSSPHLDDPQTINRISAVIRQATDKQVPISPALLDAVGKRLLEASKTNPGAWQPVLEVLGYRSGTLEFFYTVDVQFLPVPKQRFIVLKALGKDIPDIKAFGRAMMDSPEAAIVDSISSPAVRASDTGYESVLLSGGTMLLDGAHLRHVVLKDVEVHYNGGQVILEDVTFVNCRFVFAEASNSRTLASAILASPKVDFRIE